MNGSTDLSQPRTTGFQLFSTVVFASMFGLFILPSDKPTIGGSRLLSLLLAAAVEAVVLLLLLYAYRNTGAKNASQLFSLCFPKPIKAILLCLIAVYFILSAADGLATHSDISSGYLLPDTPPIVIIAALALTAAVAASAGTVRAGRVAELSLLLMLLPVFIIIAIGLYKTDYGELRILLQPDVNDVVKLLPSSMLTLSGFEVLLFLLGRSVCTERCIKPSLLGFAATTLISLLACCISAGILTADGAERAYLPILETTRVLSLGGVALTDRFDLLLIIIRIVAIIIRTGLFLFGAAYAVSSLFGSLNSRYIYGAAIIAVIAARFATIQPVDVIVSTINTYGFYVLMLALIPILFIISIPIKQRRKECEQA